MIARTEQSGAQRRGLTLVEVLVTMMLIAVVLPAIMEGIGTATSLASSAKRRNEEVLLGQSKLAEIVATGQWQTQSMSGDFGSDWPDYKWDAQVQQWAGDTIGAGIEQIDLHVTPVSGRGPDSITLTTLAFANTTTSSLP